MSHQIAEERVKDIHAVTRAQMETGCWLPSAFCAIPSEDLKFERQYDTFLIAHDGHFVGVRPWKGGREFMWMFPGEDQARRYLWRQFLYLQKDIIKVRMAIWGHPRMCASPDVPLPFDRWSPGGEKLPVPPDLDTTPPVKIWG